MSPPNYTIYFGSDSRKIWNSGTQTRGGKAVACDGIDVALVPGLAFDETGKSAGPREGVFRRLLRDLRGVRIAVAYDFQLLSEVPTRHMTRLWTSL